MSQALFSSLFRYKHWSNARIFGALRGASGVEASPDILQALRILNHVFVVDQIFIAHLTSHAHGFKALNTAGTSSVRKLGAAVERLDERYIAHVDRLGAKDLDDVIEFNFVDGSAGRMTRAQILAHVATHGDYHRGAVGMIMSRMSLPTPRPYTAFLHEPG